MENRDCISAIDYIAFVAEMQHNGSNFIFLAGIIFAYIINEYSHFKKGDLLCQDMIEAVRGVKAL